MIQNKNLVIFCSNKISEMLNVIIFFIIHMGFLCDPPKNLEFLKPDKVELKINHSLLFSYILVFLQLRVSSSAFMSHSFI
jgi:hypothetical protein